MRKIIVFLSSLTILAGCTQAPVSRWQSSEGSIWNTLYRATYRGPANLSDSIVATLHRVEQSLSPFLPDSRISLINRGETDVADSLIAGIFTASQTVNRLSDGLFDPTVAPLVNYWGFGYDTLASEPLDSIMGRVGIADCSLHGLTIVKKHPRTEFNFSAITKGFGCDEVGRMLERNGCTDYLVEIGGEIAVSGLSPRGGKWRVMVDAPIESNDSIIHDGMATIEVADCGVATSGNYRNYRLTDRGKVSHTINPRTGRPVTLDEQADTVILSATVVAPTAMEADALATAAMLLQPSRSGAMIRAAGASRLILAVATPTDSLLLVEP